MPEREAAPASEAPVPGAAAERPKASEPVAPREPEEAPVRRKRAKPEREVAVSKTESGAPVPGSDPDAATESGLLKRMTAAFQRAVLGQDDTE